MTVLIRYSRVGGVIVCSTAHSYTYTHAYTLTLLLWQYRAFFMDSVSSDQAIIKRGCNVTGNSYF